MSNFTKLLTCYTTYHFSISYSMKTFAPKICFPDFNFPSWIFSNTVKMQKILFLFFTYQRFQQLKQILISLHLCKQPSFKSNFSQIIKWAIIFTFIIIAVLPM
jgi:hypothetical protein